LLSTIFARISGEFLTTSTPVNPAKSPTLKSDFPANLANAVAFSFTPKELETSSVASFKSK
jgi:hypothetical protein